MGFYASKNTAPIVPTFFPHADFPQYPQYIFVESYFISTVNASF